MSGLCVDRNEQCRCPLRLPTEVATELLGQLSRAQTRLYYQTERIVVMGKAKLIAGLAVLALAVVAGWPIASCELANFELHEDMRDLAAQIGGRIGLTPWSTDEDLRSAVIRKAKEHEIQLEPGQVTVQRTGSHEAPTIYLAADYKVRVKLLGFSFTFHFTPSSAK
jgi:hypothetical protein